jgi:CheY-like chemotaxis protein
MVRGLMGLALLGLLLARAPAQDKQDKEEPAKKAEDEKEAPAKKDTGAKKPTVKEAEDNFRLFFKPPETAIEFWAAMKFELAVGKFKLAAEYLKGFIDKKPTDEELLQIEEEDGIATFLGSLSIPELRADAKPLVERVTRVVTAHRSNPERLRKFVKNLSAPTPEERAYALDQLRASGAAAVPFMIAGLRSSPTNSSPHQDIVAALVQLRDNAVPPLLAALEVDDPTIRTELIDVLEQRRETRAVPFLWYPSAAAKQPEIVRTKATGALLFLLGLPQEKLPPAKVALTREAERYYRHQVKFTNPRSVVVWKWDKDHLASQTLSASQAEEFYGLLFAGEAIDLDPNDEHAQVVFLSLALDKGVERSHVDQSLEKGAPEVQRLISAVNPELVVAVLDRALSEHRLPVILGAVRALGDLAHVRAVRPTGSREPALLRALYYPDRRVQLAAADALLRMPGQAPYRSGARIVEILRRTLAGGPGARVLVADFNKNRAAAEAEAVRQAGYEVEVAATGRELLRRLADAGDIDALLIDNNLPDPGLPHLLAQLRADANIGLLPVFITVFPDQDGRVPPATERTLQRLTEGYRNIWIVPLTLTKNAVQNMLAEGITAATGQPLSDPERKEQSQLAMTWLKRMATGEARGYDIRPAAAAILKAIGSPDLAALAIEAASRLPGANPQHALAAVVLSNDNAELRRAAAVQLVRHVQQFGVSLTPMETQALEKLYASGEDAKLKGSLALVLGSLRPDARVTAQRLQAYTPVYAPPEAPPEKTPAEKTPPEKEK